MSSNVISTVSQNPPALAAEVLASSSPDEDDGNWIPPTPPESPAQGVEYVADGATSYYIYNVGTGQFLTGGNSWGTQISLGTESLPYMRVVIEDANDEDFPGSVKIRLNGAFDFYAQNLGSYRTIAETHLFRDSESYGFIDRYSQSCWYWRFTKIDGSNYYYWQSAYNEEADYYMGGYMNAPWQYARGYAAGSPVYFDASIDDSNIEWAFIPVRSFSSEVMVAYETALALYKARHALYEKHFLALEYGVTTSEAGRVYMNDNATVEELTAALNNLTTQVTKAILQKIIPESSEDTPVDITQYTVINPDFEDGKEPWTITEEMGQNLQVQTANYINQDVYPVVSIKGFIEAWVPSSSGTLRDGVICQTVYGLPEGRYRIECDAIAVQQSGELDISEQTGIYLFYDNGEYSIHGNAISTHNGMPEHFTFDFNYAGAESMTIGLMAESTNCNWMGMDNFRLYAIGEMQESPAYSALRDELEAAMELAGDIKAETTLIENLESAIAVAENLIDAGSDSSKETDYAAALRNLKTAETEVQASMAEYSALQNFINRLNDEYEKYSQIEGLEAFTENVILPLYESCSNAYDDGSWTSQQIEDAILGYEPKVKSWTLQLIESISAAGTSLNNPIDITALFEDMSWGTNTSQYSFSSGYPAENPVWMNETGTSNFITSYGTAEVWNVRPFNIYREFTNLPKGRYTIQTNAFFRMEYNEANYNNWEYDSSYGKGCAYIYAGQNKANIINVAALATYDIDRAADLNFTMIDYYGIYIPNHQLAASNVFADPQLSEATRVSVSGSVTSNDDVLRVGIAGTSDLLDNQWTVWGSFRIYFNGANTVDNMDDDIMTLINQAEEANAHGVMEGYSKLEDAISYGYSVLGGSDTDAKEAAIAKLNDAINYTKESAILVEELLNKHQYYMERMWNLEGSYNNYEYPELIDRIENAYGEEKIENNQQIMQWLDQLQTGWYEFILSDEYMDYASFKEPYDMTALITNASFDNNDENGWIITNPINESEPVINRGMTREGIAEFWNSSEFDIHQTLPELKKGYWRLTMNGLMRAGSSADEIFALNDGTSEDLINELYLYAWNPVNYAETKVCQWSNFEKGAVVINWENEYLIDQIYSYETYSYLGDDGEIEFVAANYQNTLRNFFENSRYINTVDFEYTDEGTPVTIGLKMLETCQNNWCPFDNFRLYYLGETYSEPIARLGDANCDGTVDVVDVTTVVDFILLKAYPTAVQKLNADVNKDGVIDVVDLTSIVSIILGTYHAPANNAAGIRARIDTDDVLRITESGIALENSREYVAFQMDVTLTDGATLDGVELAQRSAESNVTYQKIAANTYRIIVFSLDNTPFTGNAGTLLNLNVNGQWTIDNVVFSDGFNAYRLLVNDATGIYTMTNGQTTLNAYDLSGRRVTNLNRGSIYMINGKKVLVK